MSDHGTFHWNELMTNDVEGAKAFYGASLGWTFNEFGGPDFVYWVCMAGDTPVGGIMPLEGTAPEGASPYWYSYIAVDDVDARVGAVKSAGGTVLREPFEIPMVGRIALILDPNGAGIGIITPVRE